MLLMSHKISNFQLVSIVKNLICAATRGAAFLSCARGREFCQNRAKNLDISLFFSTHPAHRWAQTRPPRLLRARNLKVLLNDLHPRRLFIWRLSAPARRGFYGSALCLRALRKNPVSRRKRVTVMIPQARCNDLQAFQLSCARPNCFHLNSWLTRARARSLM